MVNLQVTMMTTNNLLSNITPEKLASEKDADDIFLKYLKEIFPDDKYMTARDYISYQACENYY